jgi:hypothetical protein
MNRMKGTLLTIGAVAAAALTLGIFAPKVAHAAQEMIVLVGNTRANPVPNLDVDQPARHPYTATCSRDLQGTTISCLPMPLPPANSATVIQSVDMSLNTFGVAAAMPVNGAFVYTQGGHSATTYVPFTVPPTGSGTGFWPAHELTAIYLDPSSSIGCSINAVGLAPDGIITCTISGYSVSLP